MQDIVTLNLDSELFGYKVAKIVPQQLDAGNLQRLLSNARSQKIRLVYWAIADGDALSEEAAIVNHGQLVDHKITFAGEVSTIEKQTHKTVCVAEYTSTEPDANMLTMAYHIGAQSRFGRDPNITASQMQRMYRTWLVNSLRHKAADVVLASCEDGQTSGFVALQSTPEYGRITLIAVHPKYRRRGIATSLIHASMQWMRSQGRHHTRVTTQKTNDAACRLYERCGYHPFTTQRFYHFWL